MTPAGAMRRGPALLALAIVVQLIAGLAAGVLLQRPSWGWPAEAPRTAAPSQEDTAVTRHAMPAPALPADDVAVVAWSDDAHAGPVDLAPTVPELAPASPSADTPDPPQPAPPQPAPPQPAPPDVPASTATAPSQTTPRSTSEPDTAPPPVSDGERVFASEFPVHAAARQDPADPSTAHWAVLVGINRYGGRVGNTLGSVADAFVLRDVLLAHGWRDDHILVLTDTHATHDRIVRAIEWLARATDEHSTVVFSFSGHLRHRSGVTALWPADSRYVWAGDLGRMLGAVPAGRMWVSLQGCHAAGLRAAGVEGPGRVVTYSSRVDQKSYEDPEVGHSVQGFYLFNEGLRQGWGDGDADGRVSVQEAFAWAAPRAETRTSGLQSPVLADGLGTPLHLGVTEAIGG